MEITQNNIKDYLYTIDSKRKEDIKTLLKLFNEVTNLDPKIWGSIVGYGNLHYKYASKREGNMPILGFANRKQALTLYLSYSISENPLLTSLGKHKVSKSCLYINKLGDIDLNVLKKIMEISFEEVLALGYERIE